MEQHQIFALLELGKIYKQKYETEWDKCFGFREIETVNFLKANN